MLDIFTVFGILVIIIIVKFAQVASLSVFFFLYVTFIENRRSRLYYTIPPTCTAVAAV